MAKILSHIRGLPRLVLGLFRTLLKILWRTPLTLLVAFVGAIVGVIAANILILSNLGFSWPYNSVQSVVFQWAWIIAGIVVSQVLLWKHAFGSRQRAPEITFGSARLANDDELKTLTGPQGLLIGRSFTKAAPLLRYDGPAHLLTIAPTRSGKGVGTIIPNLLGADRSVLVVDPKGDNARIAGRARDSFGKTFVLDPFGVSGRPSAAFNPLAALAPDAPDLLDDASSLAEAIIHDPPEQVTDAHWNEEARALRRPGALLRLP